MLDALWDWLLRLPAILLDWLVAFARQRPYVVFLIVVAIVRSFGTTVRSGRAGVLFFCGRVRKVLEPGFHPLIPILHAVKQTPVRSVTLDLPRQRVSSADGLVYDVDASIIYRVEDPAKALTAVDDVKRGVSNVVPLLVAEVMRGQTLASLAARPALDADLMARTQQALARWGLVVEQAGLNSIAPTRVTARLTQLGARVRERAGLVREQMTAGVPAGLAVALVAAGTAPRSRARARYHRRREAPRPAPPRPLLPVKPPETDGS
jgi:regulator of protease activity HflC (stomatin/prohibitin superfamily)